MGAFPPMRSSLARLVCAALLACASACGPVQSTAYLLDAAVQIEAARTAQAEKYAPYEWTSANLYLHKAREEVGYSDFEQAVSYSKKASTFANKARDNAMKAARKEEPPAEPGVQTIQPGGGG
jgi:hypothetical protein